MEGIELSAVVSALVFFLPAYVANVSAGCFGGGRALDMGRSFLDRRRLLGDGKTVRGTVAGVLCGTAYKLAENLYLSRSLFSELQLAFLLSAGAMTGDLVGSFIKRRLGIESGESAPLLDQLDFAIGALLFAGVATTLSMERVVILLLITPVGHLAVNILGFLMHRKEVPW